MRKLRAVACASALMAFTGIIALPSTGFAADAANLEEGRKIAEDRAKGNCLACHIMGKGDSPGDLGPPLVAMSARYPDRAKLRAQIWDATKANPETIMPAFGKYQALSEEEIDKVVDYLLTL